MDSKTSQKNNSRTDAAKLSSSDGVEAKTYNSEGKVVGSITLPAAVFGVPWNADLIHQVVVSMQANARTPVAHTKGRGEVRGGGKKPWQQKGTGRARHGSRRSPIWRGGGVTHGPRNEKDYSKRINKKMRTKALYTALSRKLKDEEVIFVDALTFSAPKAAQAKAVLTALSGAGFQALTHKKRNAALLVLPESSDQTQMSFRNFGNVSVQEVRSLNPVEVLSHKYVVVAEPEKALSALSARAKVKAAADADEPKKKAPTKRRAPKTPKA